MITDDEIKAARALCEGWKGRFIVHVEHDPEDHYEYLSIGFVDSDGNETLELDAPRDLCAPLVDLLNAPLTLVPRMLAEVERLRRRWQRLSNSPARRSLSTGRTTISL